MGSYAVLQTSASLLILNYAENIHFLEFILPTEILILLAHALSRLLECVFLHGILFPQLQYLDGFSTGDLFLDYSDEIMRACGGFIQEVFIFQKQKE